MALAAPVHTAEGYPLVPPWWTPARVAVCPHGRWFSVRHDYTFSKATETIAVSPVDRRGRVHFVAWDVDSAEPGDVRKILASLPPGAVPLVSWSGKKGWHIWLFPETPLDVQQAVQFAKDVQRRAGVQCEVYPSSANSRLLKWPGSRHPETGEVEVFVPVDSLNDTDTLDTPLILELLAEGRYRTPLRVFGGRMPPGPAEVRGKLVSGLGEIVRSEEVAQGLLALAGRNPVPLGKAFRCILPGHWENRPSAAFYREARNGTIVYHDFHASKYEDRKAKRKGKRKRLEFLSLGEVYAALETGKVRKLKPHECSRWAAKLALRLGYTTTLVEEQRQKLTQAGGALAILQETDFRKESPKNINSLLAAAQDRFSGGRSANNVVNSGETEEGDIPDWEIIRRVWEVVSREAEIRGFAGFDDMNLASRFVAREAGVSLYGANRALNLLACLGVLEKVPGTGGWRGDRFRLCPTSPEEVRRRWEALGRPSLRRLTREYVGEKLGEDVTKAIFRRTSEKGEPQDGRLEGERVHGSGQYENSPRPLSPLWPDRGLDDPGCPGLVPVLQEMDEES